MNTALTALLTHGLATHVFPGAVLLVWKEGQVLFHEAYGYANLFDRTPVTRETFFDLASLTKPLATTLAIMDRVDRGKLVLDQPLGKMLPDIADWQKKITIRDLLRHTSGLPAYRPYFKVLSQAPLEVREKLLYQLLDGESPQYPCGTQTVYSDLGFMMLKHVMELSVQKPLDFFVTQEIYKPLAIDGLFFVKAAPLVAEHFAATEVCPWRNQLLQGVVHDDNAYALGGVAGHAGLFGTARAVCKLLVELLKIHAGQTGRFSSEVMRLFLQRDLSAQRALGFDVPSLSGSSSGRYFSSKSAGHLGFTGTSFWMDLERQILIVLLTNRVHPTRENEKIKQFRPVLHDLVMEKMM